MRFVDGIYKMFEKSRSKPALIALTSSSKRAIDDFVDYEYCRERGSVHPFQYAILRKTANLGILQFQPLDFDVSRDSIVSAFPVIKNRLVFQV